VHATSCKGNSACICEAWEGKVIGSQLPYRRKRSRSPRSTLHCCISSLSPQLTPRLSRQFCHRSKCPQSCRPGAERSDQLAIATSAICSRAATSCSLPPPCDHAALTVKPKRVNNTSSISSYVHARNGRHSPCRIGMNAVLIREPLHGGCDHSSTRACAALVNLQRRRSITQQRAATRKRTQRPL
jgi:hypothetical protein